MRDRITVIAGAVLVAIGVLWMLDGPLDLFNVPWEFVLPGVVIAIGLVLMLGRTDGGNDGKPPSQFERDDAPRVP